MKEQKVLGILSVPQECGKSCLDIINLDTTEIIQQIDMDDYYNYECYKCVEEFLGWEEIEGTNGVTYMSISASVKVGDIIKKRLNTFKVMSCIEVTATCDIDRAIFRGEKALEVKICDVKKKIKAHYEYDPNKDYFRKKMELLGVQGMEFLNRRNIDIQDACVRIIEQLGYECLNLYRY